MRTNSSIRTAALVAVFAATACSKHAEPHAPAPEATSTADPGGAPGATPAATSTQRSIEAGDINRSADPCGDFFEYANGTWRAQNPIPAGRPKWTRREAARDAAKQRVPALVKELASKSDWPAGSAEQLVGDHYAACMDEAAVDTAGLSPLKPLLAEIDAAKVPTHVQRVIRRLHDLGIAGPFGEAGAFDNHEPKDYLLNFVAGSLGLPDRDAYLKTDPPAAELRAKYRQHVARVLALGGMPEKATLAAADGVVALEKRLAEASLDAKHAGDPAATEHKTTYAQLKAMAPHVDWDKYFDEAALPRDAINVAEPKLLQQVDKELNTTPVAVWKAYLRWQLLDAASPWLSKPFAEEAFAFKDRTLGGATEPRPRELRCAELTEALLGEPVGKKYAEKYFPPAAKAKAREVANNLLAVMKDDVAALPWLTPGAKKMALEKITTMSVQLGYPDHWKDVSKIQIRRDALWADIAQARQFNVDDVRRQVGKPTDRNGWVLPPSSPGAYLDPQLNELVLPAGFLQPPFFDIELSDAAIYGSFGAGMAHDMTHAFDATGAAVDALGHTQDWWTEVDHKEFQKRAQCIIDQYEGFAIEPGVHHNGKQVLDEALGDQAGIHFAYLALKKSMATHPVPTLAGRGEPPPGSAAKGQRGSIDGFTPEQQFFLAWGQFRGEAMAIETQRQLVKGDIHPVPKFRVLGPLANLPEFGQAFSCKAGAAMTRSTEQRCVVW